MKIKLFSSFWFLYLAVSSVCLLVSSFFGVVLVAGILLTISLGAVTFLFIRRSRDHSKALSLLFIFVFIVHIVATLFVYYNNFQPFSGGRGDFTEYEAIAQEVSNRLHSGNFSLDGISLGHYYPVIVGYIYAIATPDVLIGQLFNAWLLALLVIAVYFIVLEIGASKKEAFIVGLVASFYPSLAFFGSLLLKESLAGLLCMTALLMMVKIFKKFSWLNFFIFYILLIGITHFRFYISYALVFTFIICWALFSGLKIRKRVFCGIFIIVLFGFLPNISGGEGVGQQYFGINVIRDYLSPQAIKEYREVSTQQSADTNELIVGNESVVIVKPGFEDPITFIKNTSLSFISVVLGPFPWQLKKIQHFFVLPEIIAWYFLLFFIIKGIIKSAKTKYRVIMPLAIFSFIVFGVLSLFLINYGITIRIRIPAILSLLCLFPFGFSGFKNSKIPFLNI